MRVRDLSVHFRVRRRRFRTESITAVSGVNLDIPRGETYGLVGESGCGKTSLARAVLRLIPVTQGQVLFDGTDIMAMREQPLRMLRRRMQVVFQDQYGCLPPRKTVSQIVGEALAIHTEAARDQRLHAVANTLDQVGLGRRYMNRLASQLSGGERQRVSIARAIVLAPEFVICDEPVSALDALLQVQIVNLLLRLKKELRLTLLFISHDLALVRHLADRVAVMHRGQIVEDNRTDQIFSNPQNSHTRALLAHARARWATAMTRRGNLE
ncbi:MAG: ABC transporter ATP-binding protein [Planctomycetes bacterium]|nr:ABC transporter ATP-binding protein [Planctomycetota bacterium]